MQKQIKGFEKYTIDENGIVRNTSNGKILAQTQNKQNGYMYISIWKDGKTHKRTVHRLLAENFIDNPENKPTVDHANGNRTDNRLENLRWATYSEQNSRFWTHGIRSKKVRVVRYPEERKKRGGGHVRWLSPDKEMEFDSVSDCAKYFNVTISNVTLMLRNGHIGKRGKMRGYRFYYVNA